MLSIEQAKEILGLKSKIITKREVKDSYRPLALKWHPDKNNDTDTTKEFTAETHLRTNIIERISQLYETPESIKNLLHKLSSGVPRTFSPSRESSDPANEYRYSNPPLFTTLGMS